MFEDLGGDGVSYGAPPEIRRLEAARRGAWASDAERGLAVLDFYDSLSDPDERFIPREIPFPARVRAFLQQTALALGKSEWAISREFSTLHVARTHLPASFEVFAAARCSFQQLSIVVRQGDGLDEAEHVASFDAEAAALIADPQESPAELERQLHDLRERLDPASAERRRDRAHRGRGIRIRPLPNGQATLSLTADAVEVCAAADAIHQAAVAAHGIEDETRSLGQLKADIALDLILAKSQEAPGVDHDSVVLDGVDVTRTRVPARKPVTPSVLITIPASTAAGGDEPGHLTGYGPIAATTARQAAGDAGYWTRLFTDPTTGGLVDIDVHSRMIPVAVRNWLRARNDRCGHPGCNRPESACDIDHARRFEYQGPTHPDNLSFLCRPHHRDKDAGMWGFRLHPDGTQTWTSRWGRTYRTKPRVPDVRPRPPMTVGTDPCPF